jgi:uncharacterized membrane protein YoaK (UPF0700 family)
MTTAEPGQRLDALDLGLAALALGAGIMDALGFLALGGALPSAMTGNTALLGLALGRGDLAAAASPFTAAVGFAFGVAAATLIDHRLAKGPVLRAPASAIARLLILEAGLLACFALGWQAVGRPAAGPAHYLLILLGAGGMGLQSFAARKIGRSGVTTVVFTSTLTALVAAVTTAVLRRPLRLDSDARRQGATYLAYLLGAVAGGFLAWHGDVIIAFLPPAAAVLAAALHLGAARSQGRR